MKPSYSAEETATARRVFEAVVSCAPRDSRLPSIFVPIGGHYVYGGVRYKCVARPRDIRVRDCCKGCSFSKLKGPCPVALQCSKFDRRDKKFVWFVREEE